MSTASENLQALIATLETASPSTDVEYFSEADTDCVGGQYQLYNGLLFVHEADGQFFVDYGVDCSDWSVGICGGYEPAGSPKPFSDHEQCVEYILAEIAKFEADHAKLCEADYDDGWE